MAELSLLARPPAINISLAEKRDHVFFGDEPPAHDRRDTQHSEETRRKIMPRNPIGRVSFMTEFAVKGLIYDAIEQ